MLIPGFGGPALRLSWLVAASPGAAPEPLLDTAGQVALSTCPGRPDSHTQLGVDLRELVRQGVTCVLSLVEDDEMSLYGVTGLADGLARYNLRHLRYPIVDREPPTDLAATRALCEKLLRLLGEGERLLIHCIGGWGRSGTIAAALLIHEGHDADQAIALVRAARHPFCVQTAAQEDFLRTYATAHADVARRTFLIPRRALGTRLSGPPGERRLRLLGLSSLSPAELRAQARREALEPDLIALGAELPPGPPPNTVLIDRAHVASARLGLRPLPLSALFAPVVD